MIGSLQFVESFISRCDFPNDRAMDGMDRSLSRYLLPLRLIADAQFRHLDDELRSFFPDEQSFLIRLDGVDFSLKHGLNMTFFRLDKAFEKTMQAMLSRDLDDQSYAALVEPIGDMTMSADGLVGLELRLRTGGE